MLFIRNIRKMREFIGIKVLSIGVLACLLTACPSNSSQHPKIPKAHTPTQHHYFSKKSTHHSDTSKSNSLWRVMGPQFKLAKRYDWHRSVRHQIRWFEHHPVYVKSLTRNATPYIYYVYQQAKARHIPLEIALLPMIESNYNPFRYSYCGATGLWQLMPGTASGYDVKINWWFDGRRDIISSTNAALDHLEYLHRQFGNWLLAIAAYDSGEGTVRRAIRHNKHHGRATSFWALSLPKETKNYVPKLLALAAIISNPKHYHLKIIPVPDKPFFGTIDIKKQMNLTHIAHLADTSIGMIRKLNPGYRRWATKPYGENKLLLPVNKVEIFEANLHDNDFHYVTWLHHTVKSGQTLSNIAKQYGTSSKILRMVNHLNSNRIQSGQELLIPLKAKSAYRDHIKHIHGSIAEDKLPGPKRVVYIVKKHDSLSRIAAYFDVKPSQIRYWNSLSYRATLKPKQKLILWEPHDFQRTGFIHYKVKSGDSLSVIANRYDVSISRLKEVNDLNHSTIRIGKTLRIPTHKAKPFFPAVSKHAYNTFFHVVRHGDTLSKIAHHYHVSVKHIKQWNHLHSSILSVGQRLAIKKTKHATHHKTRHYHVRRGDSLNKIAAKYHVTLGELIKWNHLHSDLLHIGQSLIIK